MQNWLTKRWIDVMNLFGDLTDEQDAAAKQMADQDFADTAADIEQRRQSERNQSAAGNEANLAEIAWAPSPADYERQGQVVPKLANSKERSLRSTSWSTSRSPSASVAPLAVPK